jgi:DHA3 family macrolide efflux protein-like MFS transporter
MQAEQTSLPQTSSPFSGEPKEKWYITFFAIWTGQSFSLLGSQLVQFALIWWLTKTTGSATVLAVASLIGLLPQVFLGPLAGALVDRWNRRVIMIAADSLIALSTLVLAVLFYKGSVLVWQVYLLMFLRSAAGAFHWPAMTASTALMVPKQHHARIQGFNQMLGGSVNIIAAPLGALLLELLPMQGVLAVDIGTAAIAVLPLLFIRIPEPQRSQKALPGTEKTSVGQDLRAGLRYIWEWPGAIWLMVIAMLMNMLLIPAIALMPLLVTKYFGGQAIHLATLESASGIGIVLGGLALGVWGGFRRRVYTSLLGLFLLGLGSLAVGLTPASAFGIAVVAMFVLGFANPLTNGPVFAIIQSTVEPEMQGRVLTLLGSAAAAVTPLGLIIAGPIADAFGVRAWFIAGGVLTLLLGLAVVFIPSLLHIEDGRQVKPELVMMGRQVDW